MTSNCYSRKGATARGSGSVVPGILPCRTSTRIGDVDERCAPSVPGWLAIARERPEDRWATRPLIAAAVAGRASGKSRRSRRHGFTFYTMNRADCGCDLHLLGVRALGEQGCVKRENPTHPRSNPNCDRSAGEANLVSTAAMGTGNTGPQAREAGYRAALCRTAERSGGNNEILIPVAARCGRELLQHSAPGADIVSTTVLVDPHRPGRYGRRTSSASSPQGAVSPRRTAAMRGLRGDGRSELVAAP